MKKIVLMMLMLCFALTGCLSGPSVCDTRGDQKSYLCDVADSTGVRLESAGNILMIANIGAISAKVYSKDDAVKVFKAIQRTVDGSPSYLHLQREVMRETSKYPGLFIIADSYIMSMNKPQMITTFDKKVLSVWIDRQIEILGGK